MNQRQLLWFAILAVATLAVIAMARVNVVSAQQASDAGFGGSGGAGGGAGRGGGGGGGGFGAWNRSGGGAAYGEYVYVLQQGTLYQYAAYDLTLVKKIKLKGTGAKNRIGRLGGGFGGGGGRRGGDGGEGEVGGHGGGFGLIEDGGGPSEAVAAYGEYVYVLQGATLHKLAADGLASVKKVALDADFKNGDNNARSDGQR
jgi:hypothetical protein